MSTSALAYGRWSAFVGEARKVPAFLRRDLLVLWSYRLAFFSDWFSLGVQVITFYFVGRLVNPGTLPTFGGARVSYMQFVAVGIVLTTVLQVGMGRLVAAIRQEQLIGTLESLLLSPTSPTTWQLGSVVFDLVYVPARTAIFLLLVSGLLGVQFVTAGLLPAAAVLVAFLPFVWGLGLVSAAGVLTFRHATGVVGLGTAGLVLVSGAYFPVHLLPGWIAPIARVNPIAIVLDAMRAVLLGHGGWGDVWPAILTLIPLGAASLALGTAAFRLALNRERRRGTLGMY